MALIEVDATGWPIVLVVFPAQVTDQDLETYFDKLRRFRERLEPYAIVIDVTLSQGLTPTQREMQANYIKQGLRWSRRYLKALAFVADSAWRRGFLTAVFWLQKPDSPTDVFETRAKAFEWVQEKLEAAPVSVRTP